MPTINWTVENVRVNLPSISAEEYPITVHSSISAYEVIENTSNVNYLFCFGDEVFSNSYSIDNGMVIIDTPDLSCELDSNTITVTEKTSGGGSGGESDVLIITLTYDESYNLVVDKTYAEILSAVNAGKLVLLIDDLYGYSKSYYYYYSLGENSITFYGFVPTYDNENNAVTQWGYVIDNTNSVNYADGYSLYNLRNNVMQVDFQEVSGSYESTTKTARDVNNALVNNSIVKIFGNFGNGYESEYIIAWSGNGPYTFKTLTKTFTAVNESSKLIYTSAQ